MFAILEHVVRSPSKRPQQCARGGICRNQILTRNLWAAGSKTVRAPYAKFMAPDFLPKAPPNTDAISMSGHVLQAFVQGACLGLLARPLWETPVQDLLISLGPPAKPPGGSLSWNALQEPLARIVWQITIQNVFMPLEPFSFTGVVYKISSQGLCERSLYKIFWYPGRPRCFYRRSLQDLFTRPWKISMQDILIVPDLCQDLCERSLCEHSKIILRGPCKISCLLQPQIQWLAAFPSWAGTLLVWLFLRWFFAVVKSWKIKNLWFPLESVLFWICPT